MVSLRQYDQSFFGKLIEWIELTESQKRTDIQVDPAKRLKIENVRVVPIWKNKAIFTKESENLIMNPRDAVAINAENIPVKQQKYNIFPTSIFAATLLFAWFKHVLNSTIIAARCA